MSNPFDQFAVDLQSAMPGGQSQADPNYSSGAPAGDGGGAGGNPFSSVFADAPGAQPSPVAPKPVMNAPPQPPMAGAYGQQPPSMHGYGQQAPPTANGYGQQASPSMNGYGQQPTTNGYGNPPPNMNGYAQPTPPPPGQPQMTMGQGQVEKQPSMYGSLEMPVGYDPRASVASLSSFSQPPPTPSSAPSDPFQGYGQPPAQPPAASAGIPPSSPNPYGGANSAPIPQSAQLTSVGQPSPNPYGGAPPQMAAPPAQAPPVVQPSPNPYGAPPGPLTSAGYPPSSDPFGGYGVPPAASNSNPYGPPPHQTSEPYAQPGAIVPASQQHPPPGGPQSDPFGGYGMQQPGGAPAAPYGDPFGAPQPAGQAPPADPTLGALVPSQQPAQAYPGAPPPPGPGAVVPANDPFAVFNSAPAPAPQPTPAVQQQQYHGQPSSQALVPAQAPPAAAGGGDLWGDLGFDSPPEAGVPSVVGGSAQEEKKDSGDLPPGGEYYDARIFTPTLGVMFFKPQELTDSLFLNTDRGLVDGLAERPVVAFIVEGSSARSAGVELGHVLLKVNGVDVKNPKEASRLIKEGPRPLPLMFYVPNTDVVVAEGEHMVKYDTRETTAPNSAKDWKPKYVVIGGIIAQPWMMNMYRSKSEYDIAVIETQARRPVSVKVKQFSLQGARIQNDWQGPQMVKYKNKLHPWKYIVVLPVARNPIKISSPNLAQLKPVHEGIRRVLLAQQRSRGGNAHSAAPVGQRDPYSGQTYNRGGGEGPPPQQQQYPPQQQQAPPQVPQNYGYAQPSGYTGGY